MLLEPAAIAGVDLVAVTVALGNLGRAVNLRHPAAALEHGRIGAEPHGAAEIAVEAARLRRVTLQPFRHQPDHGLARRAELGRIRLLDAAEVARGFDDGHLHAEANPEIRHLPLTGKLCGLDLAFGTALAEAA